MYEELVMNQLPYPKYFNGV